MDQNIGVIDRIELQFLGYTMTLTLYSPAKINLFLRVVRRRQDGYHDLASLFQTIDLYDTLHFTPSEYDNLTCTDPTLRTDHTNLISKAIALFRHKTAFNTPLSIHLEKVIPQQAGLGGGSSNAATTLWALNQLHGSPATMDELARWGAELGSDVAFFFSQGTAYCTGRGEILRPLQPLWNQTLTIVKPQEGLSTPLVFKNLKINELIPRDPEKILEGFLAGSPTYFNDLEEPAFSLLPSLADLKQQLQNSGYTTVLMSGSGSSFFCLGNGSPPISCAHYHAKFINRSINSWFNTH